MTYDDMEPQLVKEACEQNVALTGDSSWACKPSKVYPIIEVPGPNDFIPHPIDETTGQGRGGIQLSRRMRLSHDEESKFRRRIGTVSMSTFVQQGFIMHVSAIRTSPLLQ